MGSLMGMRREPSARRERIYLAVNVALFLKTDGSESDPSFAEASQAQPETWTTFNSEIHVTTSAVEITGEPRPQQPRFKVGS